MSLYYPSPEQVIIAWAKTVLPDPTQIATSLPAAGWTGFVTVLSLGGSPPDPGLPVSAPVVRLDCWAAAANSGQPPWGVASQLAERLYLATLMARQPGTLVAKADFHPAMVRAVYPLSVPRRVDGDPSGYARYTVDVQAHYSLAVTS